MALTKATRHRLTLLAVVLVLGGVVAALYGVRQVSIRRGLGRDLREGMAAYQDKRFADAIAPLSRYISQRRNDPEVLLAFADARRRVPSEVDTPTHLRQALSVARLALDLEPESLRGRVLLMEIAVQSGYLTEANEAAERVLEQDPANFEAHQVRVAAATETGRGDECIRVSREMAEALPTNFVAQSLALDQLFGAQMALAELGPYVEERRRPFEGRIASELLAARLILYEASLASSSEARSALESRFNGHVGRAVSLRPAEPEEAEALVRLLDARAGGGGAVSADELVRRYLADPELAPRLMTFAVRRAWQREDQGLLREIVGRSADPPALDAETLGWLAISLLPQARGFREELERRSDQRSAAWVRIAEAAGRLEEGDASAACGVLSSLLTDSDKSISAAARYFNAIGLRALGEASLADAQMEELAQEPVWVRARTLLWRNALARGDYRTALDLLRKDYLPGTGRVQLEAAVSLDESGHKWVNEPSGRQLADRALSGIRDDPVLLSLHGRAELAAGGVDRALEVADQIAQMDPADGREYILRFADRLAEFDGARAANLRARWAGTRADPLQRLHEDLQKSPMTMSELRSRIEEATRNATPELRLQGSLLLASALDQLDDPAALEEFARLSADSPDNARVQIAALKSRAVWADPSAVEAILARLRALTGESGIAWQLYQYKLTLLRDNSEATAAGVIHGLSNILRLAPDDVLALQLMAECMTRIGDFARAATYASRAADAAPDNLGVTLDAIDALVRAEQADEAATRLAGASAKPADSVSSRIRRASLLDRFGMAEGALADWAWLAHADAPETRALAAVELAEGGRREEAGAVVASLVVSDELSSRARVLTADALAALGRRDEGRELLSGANRRGEPGDTAAVVADYLGRHATTPGHLQELEDFVRTTDSAGAWAASVRRYMGVGRSDDARRVLADAMTRVREPSQLVRYARALDADIRADQNAFLSVAQTSLSSVDAQWARELSDRFELVISGEESMEDCIGHLQEFVLTRPQHPVGWMLLARAQASVGDIPGVRRTIQAMLEALPSDPEPARSAANLFRSLRLVDEGLIAARELAARLGAPTLECACRIAEFALAAQKRQEAWNAMSPWRDSLESDADRNLYASAALSVGEIAEAGRVAWGRDGGDLEWTHEAVRMSEWISTATDRRSWLSTAASRLPASDDPGRLLLANAWCQLAVDFGDAAALASALELTEPDAVDPDVEASLSLIQGSCLSELGRPGEAIRSYRRVLELRPHDPKALNDLAYLLLEHERTPAEALGLAQRAVEVVRASGVPADALVEYLDTLGTALLRSGRPADALAAFNKALAARPTYAFSRVGLAETLVELGRRDEAKQVLARLDGPVAPALADRVRVLRETLH